MPLPSELVAQANAFLQPVLQFALANRLSIGGVVFGLIAAVNIYLLFIRQYFSPLRNIPGPPKAHWLLGNMGNIMDHGPQEIQWTMGQKFGQTYKVYGACGRVDLSTSDLKAVNYILLHPDLFIKPAGPNRVLTDALGKGLVTSEGPIHRRQRRVLNPAFGWIQVQEMAPAIFSKAHELRRRMTEMIENADKPDPKDIDSVPGSLKMDVLLPLSAATLDIIGLVGFGYDLKALTDEPNQLREAYTGAIGAAFDLDLPALLQLSGVPGGRFIPSKRRNVLQNVCRTSQRIGGGIVAEKKRLVTEQFDGKVKKSTDIGKDVVALLIKANMAPDLRDDQRMSDEDIMHQISTVLFAGHETTGTALMWCLWRLAQVKDVQQRLRDELQAVDGDEPSFEELHALPYLDKVVHESLRLESPIPLTIREATRDAVLPLDKPIVGLDGKLIESIKVNKGDSVHVPIAYINTTPKIWGPDSLEFNPDRWDKTHTHIPAVWGNIMSFIGGPRNCIGHRLTILEMKIVLFAIIRAFEFDIPPSKPVMKRTWLVIQRAVVEGEEKLGPQMPLMVRPL